MVWRTPVRRLLIASAGIAAAVSAQPPASPVLDIRAGALAAALTAFAQQGRQQLLFSPELVRGRRAQAVHGALPPEQALARILRGSGLHAERAPAGAWLIVPDRTPVPEPQRAAPPVRPALPIAPALPMQVLEDIVIVGTPGGGTGRREAAYALTTIDQPAIERLAPAATAEVLRLVPGLTIETSGGKNGANIFVRGYPSAGDAEYVTFQSEGVPFFPPATLSFLENSQLIRLDDTVRRVEAVRGGTSALFASGQPGVTINIIQREGGTMPEGEAKASLFSDGERRIDAYLAGPLASRTGFMVGGYYSRGDGIRSPGFDADRGGQISANLHRDFAAGSLLLFGRYLNDRSQWLLPIPVTQHGRRIAAYPGFDAGTGTLVGPDTRRGVLDDGSRYDLADGRGARVGSLGGNAELRLSGSVTLRDKFSWLGGDADTIGLVSSAVPPVAAADYAARLGGTIGRLAYVDTGAPAPAAQPVLEAGIWRVAKHIDAAVNDATIAWHAGANMLTGGIYATRYTSRDRWDLGNTLLLTATPRARRLDLTLTDGTIVTRDGFTGGTSFAVDAHYRGDDLAFYGVDEVQLDPRWRGDVGLRYQRHRVDGIVANERPLGIGGRDGDPTTLYDDDEVAPDGTVRRLRYRGDAWSWTIGSNYDFTMAFGAFARFSRGHSFPFFDNLRDGIDLAPRVDTAEAGLKVASPALTLYATAFHNRFRGLATTVIAGGAPIASVGGARATGFELEGTLRPLRRVSVAFTGSWLDARYRDFFTDGGATPLAGNRVQRQPQWQWRISPAWDFAVAGRAASLHATLGYTGDRWSDVQNRQLLPGFVKLDAGATWQPTTRITVELVADNLTNAIGLTEGNPRMIGAQASGPIFARLIPGRSAQISARYRF